MQNSSREECTPTKLNTSSKKKKGISLSRSSKNSSSISQPNLACITLSGKAKREEVEKRQIKLIVRSKEKEPTPTTAFRTEYLRGLDDPLSRKLQFTESKLQGPSSSRPKIGLDDSKQPPVLQVSG